MAKQRYLSPNQINELTEKVRTKGMQSRLDLKIIQDSFSRIVIRSGLKNSGMVRTYDESVKFLKRIYGEKYIEYTFEEYQSELTLLNKMLRGYQTITGYYTHYRQNIINTVASASEYLGIEPTFDISKIQTAKLLEYVRMANDYAKSSSQGSPSFYQYLIELLEENHGQD